MILYIPPSNSWCKLSTERFVRDPQTLHWVKGEYSACRDLCHNAPSPEIERIISIEIAEWLISTTYPNIDIPSRWSMDVSGSSVPAQWHNLVVGRDSARSMKQIGICRVLKPLKRIEIFLPKPRSFQLWSTTSKRFSMWWPWLSIPVSWWSWPQPSRQHTPH